MLMARALQIFMPGKPQVWYLDLLGGANDYEAMKRAGEGGHKEINRSNLTAREARRRMELPLVKEQLRLLRLRNEHPAFEEGNHFKVRSEGHILTLSHERDGAKICLRADLAQMDYRITEA